MIFTFLHTPTFKSKIKYNNLSPKIKKVYRVIAKIESGLFVGKKSKFKK